MIQEWEGSVWSPVGTSLLRISRLPMPKCYDLWVIHSKKISVIDFDFGGPNHPSMVGLAFSGEVSEISFNNGMVDETNYGVALGTNGITNVDMRNVDFGENVNYTIFNDDPANSGVLRMFDCSLDGAKELFTLNATGPTVQVDLFNCTYDRSLLWNITGDAMVNEWYDLDLFVTDGNQEPLNTNLELLRSSFLKMVDQDSVDGTFLDIPVKSKWTNGSVEMDVQHDMLIRANDHSGNLISYEGWNIESPLYLDITMDLRPVNDMPDSLDVNEDLWLEYDMKDHFTDPENKILVFDIETGPNLDASIVGLNRTLKLMNEPMDWFGTSWVNVSATDTGYNTTYANVTLNVLPVNDAPRLSESLPDIEIDEDENWTIDLGMYVYDVEDDSIGITAGPIENCTLMMSGTNLTLEPATDWFGTLFIPVEFSDGLDPLETDLKAVILPVNDAPIGILQKEDTPIGTFEWNHTTYGNISVHRITLNEDTRSEFWINATDADGDSLNYSFIPADLKNGTITNAQMEVTLPDNTTEMVSVPYRFIYTPKKDSTGGESRKVPSD